jgi:hypothetical protein
MKRFSLLWLCILAPFALSAVAPASGQTLTAAPQPPASGNLQLEPVKQLRKDIDLWPLIAHPGTPPEVRVNALLTKLNLRLADTVRECNRDVLTGMKGAKARDRASAVAADWSRTVLVTMTGPRFLSLVATDETFCGGAHPDGSTMAMVFDMTTGTPVNWLALVAKSAGASTFVDSVSDGSKVGALVLPALQKINAARASSDCKDAFQDQQPFELWPDATHETLVAQAFDLPHVVQACAEEIGLKMKQARDLGFDEGLLTAIEQAHRRVPPTPQH